MDGDSMSFTNRSFEMLGTSTANSRSGDFSSIDETIDVCREAALRSSIDPVSPYGRNRKRIFAVGAVGIVVLGVVAAAVTWFVQKPTQSFTAETQPLLQRISERDMSDRDYRPHETDITEVATGLNEKDREKLPRVRHNTLNRTVVYLIQRLNSLENKLKHIEEDDTQMKLAIREIESRFDSFNQTSLLLRLKSLESSTTAQLTSTTSKLESRTTSLEALVEQQRQTPNQLREAVANETAAALASTKESADAAATTAEETKAQLNSLAGELKAEVAELKIKWNERKNLFSIDDGLRNNVTRISEEVFTLTDVVKNLTDFSVEENKGLDLLSVVSRIEEGERKMESVVSDLTTRLTSELRAKTEIDARHNRQFNGVAEDIRKIRQRANDLEFNLTEIASTKTNCLLGSVNPPFCAHDQESCWPYTTSVTFSKPFHRVPSVAVALSKIDTLTDEKSGFSRVVDNVVIQVGVVNADRGSFIVVIDGGKNEGNNHLFEVGVTWIACA